MALQENTLDTGEALLNYAENGGTGGALVFVHGLTLRWQDMSSLIEPLSPHHVFACDLRGHGKSSHSRSGYPLGAYVDDVVHLITERVRATTVIVGSSLGGLVAAGVAAAIPSMTAGVVLLDPILLSRNAPFEAMSYSDAHPWVTMVYQALTAGEAESDTARRLQALNPDAPDEDALEWARHIRTMDPLAIEYVMTDRLLDGFDLEDALRHVRCPALLLGGEVPLGGLVRDTDVEFFLSLVENGSAHRLPDAGHNLLDEGSAAKVLHHLAMFLPGNDSLPDR